MTVESWRIERNPGIEPHQELLVVDDDGDYLATLVPDTRLQTIADAWNELSTLHKHHVRTSAGKLVATIEDALTEENS